MDITNARINSTVEPAEPAAMLTWCDTYHHGVTHGLVIDADDRFGIGIVVRWIDTGGLQDIAYQLPPETLVESTRPAPPRTVQIRRRLTDGHNYSDQSEGSYFTAREALFWLESWSALARSAYDGTQAPDPDSPIPGAFTVTRRCGDYTEVRYLAPVPAP